MDKIEITGLTLNTFIGVYAWEQKIRQRLLIDLSIPYDLADCKDNLDNTLDYAAICQHITEDVENHSFKLIETVAEHVATLLKETFNLSEVTIKVSKPLAVKNAGNISIERRFIF